MNMSEYFKLPDFNPDLLDIAMVKSYENETRIITEGLFREEVQAHLLYWR